MATLTKKFIDGIQPDPKRDLFFWDSTLPGFGLRVKASGRMLYVLTYRNKNRRCRWLTLGQHGVLTPDQARRKALQSLSLVQSGEKDPADERDEKRGSATFGEFAERYMKEHAEIRKKPSTISEDRRFLDKYVLKVFKMRKVQEITRQDILRFHVGMSATPIQANRVLTLLHKMFNLAEEWGERPEGSNPCRRVPRYKENCRERYLSPSELGRIGQILKEAEESNTEPQAAIDTLRLLILTGARKGEILNLQWSEVDLESRQLRLSDSKTGAKVIYLNQAAVDVLKGIKRKGPWVIPGRDSNNPFVGLQKVWERIRVKAEVPDVRIHDLRHSFASVAAGLGEGLPIIGKLLGHTQVSTAQRYAQLADDPLKRANERIGDCIREALTGQTARIIDMNAEERPGHPLEQTGK